MSFFQSQKFIDYSVFIGDLDELSADSKKVINTINQYSFCIAKNDKSFFEALEQSDVLLPDGVAIVLAVRILTGDKIRKIAGADLHKYLLERYNKIGGSCFYLGSSEKTLLKIKERIHTEYPFLRVGLYSPPYKKEFSKEENDEMIRAVNDFKPDVLFIGMTAPKQEKWATLFKERIEAREICSIGAVFDFYAGTVKRPNAFWIKIGLEWLIRLINEPKRLWKRYVYYGPVFIIQIFKEKFKQLMF